jgi:hypothetical protein
MCNKWRNPDRISNAVSKLANIFFYLTELKQMNSCMRLQRHYSLSLIKIVSTKLFTFQDHRENDDFTIVLSEILAFCRL